jgi:tryptophan synthase alpha chain
MKNLNRIKDCFLDLKNKKKSALVAFVTAGDPNLAISLEVINALPNAGVDIIELGMPFSDPMADGPVIQRSYLRALKAGNSLNKTLNLVKQFRKNNQKTPLILMGYYNPILQMGIKGFIKKARSCGVDGILIVDLPPDSNNELDIETRKGGIDIIRLVTPTTDKVRLNSILKVSSGFLYYVSITGITGTKINSLEDIKKKYMNLKASIKLPFVVGFGINTPKKAKEISSYSDGVVVGSDIIKNIEKSIKNNSNISNNVINLIRKYNKAIKGVEK